MERREIRVPPICEELAEDIGFHIGDGYMNTDSHDGKTRYAFYYSGNLLLDRDYFENVLVPRKKKLYGLENIHTTDRRHDLALRFYSVELYELFQKLGVRGGKKTSIGIPPFILTGDKELQIAFLRGLFDSDGALAFKKRHKKIKYYPTVTITMKSELLFTQVKQLLEGLGFKFTASKRNNYDKRSGKWFGAHQIDINGVERLSQWMRIIGFNNKKHLDKYAFWKLNGYIR